MDENVNAAILKEITPDLIEVFPDPKKREEWLNTPNPYFARVAVTVANAASLYINARENGEGGNLDGLLRHLEIAVMNYDGVTRFEKKKAEGSLYD